MSVEVASAISGVITGRRHLTYEEATYKVGFKRSGAQNCTAKLINR